jgi:hypothetical protein
VYAFDEMTARTALAAALLWPLASLAAPPVPGVPGELRGHVTRADGKPVTRFTVNGVSFEDPEGAFKILVPPEGEFRVVVRAPGLAPNLVHVQGAAGKKLVMPEITLGSGEDVLGEIVDAVSGMPVPNARVGLADPSKVDRLRFVRPERVGDLTTTGEGGWFKIGRAPRGLLMLVVSHPDYLSAFVPVNTRGVIPTIALQRAGRIAGLVRDARGRPAPGVRIVALSEGAIDGAETVADPRGAFELRALRPGTYTIAALPGGAGATSLPVNVPDGGVAGVTLEIQAAARRTLGVPEIQLGSPQRR